MRNILLFLAVLTAPAYAAFPVETATKSQMIAEIRRLEAVEVTLTAEKAALQTSLNVANAQITSLTADVADCRADEANVLAALAECDAEAANLVEQIEFCEAEGAEDAAVVAGLQLFLDAAASAGVIIPEAQP